MSDRVKDWRVWTVHILGPLFAWYAFGSWQPAVIVFIAIVMGYLVYWDMSWQISVVVTVVFAIIMLNQMGWFDPQSIISKIGDWFDSGFDRLNKSPQ